MARPEDWGDQFPSDLDDEPPVSPTTQRTEHSYSIDPVREEAKPKDELKDFSPDPNIRQVPDAPRHVYSGTVMAHVNNKDAFPRKYWVMREDGALGTARVAKQDLYSDIKVGDEVSIIQAPEEEGWIIIGNVRPFELPQMILEIGGDVLTTQKILIPYIVKEEYPIDDSFGVDTFETIKFISPGTVQVTHDAVYEIQFALTVEHYISDNPIYYIDVEAVCPDGSYSACDVGTIVAPKIEFNKQNGFCVRQEYNNCTAFVELNCGVEDTILNKQKLNQDPFWTQSPRFGGHLTIGTQHQPSWLRWKDKDGPGIMARGKLRTMLPPQPPGSSCDFLVADAKGDDIVSLSWLKPGGNGTIKTLELVEWQYNDTTVDVSSSLSIDGYECYCDLSGEITAEVSIPVPVFRQCSYVVKRGLIISGGDPDGGCSYITPTICDDPTYLASATAEACDPCNYLSDDIGA